MLGKTMDGQKLLALFALLMLVVAGMMFRSRGSEGDPAVVLNRGNAPKLLGSGAVTGLLSGFFGIGGGFLVGPGLIAPTGMPILVVRSEGRRVGEECGREGRSRGGAVH